MKITWISWLNGDDIVEIMETGELKKLLCTM